MIKNDEGAAYRRQRMNGCYTMSLNGCSPSIFAPLALSNRKFPKKQISVSLDILASW
jgi:hypothetical protein